MTAAIYYSTAEQLEDAEHWFGPYASREIAAGKCRARFPDVGFWTAEGSAQAHKLDIFEPAMARMDGCIGDAFDWANVDTIGDDGESGAAAWTQEAVATLVQRLNAQFAGWAEEHGYQRGWTLDLSAKEWTPAPQAAPSEARERPLLSLVGER